MRNTGLDAVRGLAIALVVSAHFLPDSIVSLTGSQYLGISGVILFFFLSGFLMEQTTAEDGAVSRFFVRRAARILPMYWVSIFLAQMTNGPYDLATVLSNAGFLSDLTHSPLMIGVFWTLYVEVRFYCLVPLLRIAGEGAIKTAPYLAILLNGVLFARTGHAGHLLLYMTYCLAGMQISLWQRGKLAGIPLVICMAVIGASCAAFTPDLPFVGAVAIVSAAMVALAASSSMQFAPLQFLGRVSYGWYLLHTLFRSSLLPRLAEMGCPDWAASIVAVAASLGFAVVTFLVIERPGIRLGKILTTPRIGGPQPAISE